MSGSLLDTSVLIAGARDVSAVLPASAAISIVSVGELHAGVRLARDPAVVRSRQDRLRGVRAAFEAIPVDDAVAERYGEILAFARSEKRIVKATDLLIIATAAATERELVTLDDAQRRLATAAGVRCAGD